MVLLSLYTAPPCLAYSETNVQRFRDVEKQTNHLFIIKFLFLFFNNLFSIRASESESQSDIDESIHPQNCHTLKTQTHERFKRTLLYYDIDSTMQTVLHRFTQATLDLLSLKTSRGWHFIPLFCLFS